MILVQEVRSWPWVQNVLLGSELFTDVGLDTAVAIPREIACDVRENYLGQKGARFSSYLVPSGVQSIFHATVVTPHSRRLVEAVERNGGDYHQSSSPSSHLQNRDWI